MNWIRLVFNMRTKSDRTKSDIVLKNKAYKIATNPKYDGF